MGKMIMVIDDYACIARTFDAGSAPSEFTMSSIVGYSKSANQAITFPIGTMADKMGGKIKENKKDPKACVAYLSDFECYGLYEIICSCKPEEDNNDLVNAYLTALIKGCLQQIRRKDWIKELELRIPFFDGQGIGCTSQQQCRNFQLAAHQIGSVAGLEIQVKNAHEFVRNNVLGDSGQVPRSKDAPNAQAMAWFFWRNGISSVWQTQTTTGKFVFNQRQNNDEEMDITVHVGNRAGDDYSIVVFFLPPTRYRDCALVEAAAEGLRMAAHATAKLYVVEKSTTQEKFLLIEREFDGDNKPRTVFKDIAVKANRKPANGEVPEKDGETLLSSPARFYSDDVGGSNLTIEVTLTPNDKKDAAAEKVAGDLPLDEYDDDKHYLVDLREQTDGALHLVVYAGSRPVPFNVLTKSAITDQKLQGDGGYRLILNKRHETAVQTRKKLIQLLEDGVYYYGQQPAESGSRRKRH